MRIFLPAGQPATRCRTIQRHLLPLRGYEQFPFFTNSSNFWEPRQSGRDGRTFTFIFPFHLLPIQQSTLRASSGTRLSACLSSSSAPPPPPCSRGGRPVSAKPIGKQRPKMNFPVSFPSPMSKHSNRSRKNVAKPSCWPAIFAHDVFHCCRAALFVAKI